MTGCFARTILRLLLSFIAAASLAAAPAMAQQSPRSLLPDRPLDLRETPPETEPDSPGVKTGINVDTLDAVAIDNVGLIDAASGGFDIGMWADTPRWAIEQLISEIPPVAPSRALGSLRRRLLLTTAHVPPADSPSGATLLQNRARILFNAGDLAPLDRLLAQVSAHHRDEALFRLQTDMALLANDLPHACAIAVDRIVQSQDVYWQKVNTFCDAMAGAAGRAELGMRLLAELGVEDERFFAFMRRLADSEAEISFPEVKRLRALDVAILRGAGTPPPVPDDVAAVPLPFLRSFVGFAQSTEKTSIALLERAEQFGLADSEELARAYRSAAEDEAADSAAARYRAVMAWTSALGQAEAILEAGTAAAERGRFDQAARLYAPLVRQMQPTPDLRWFAPAAVRVLLANGDYDAVRPWVALAEREAGLDPEMQAAWHELWPLVRLAAGDVLTVWDVTRLRDWRAITQDKHAETEAEKAALLYGLLEALGEPLPSALWRELVDPLRPRAGHMADLVLLRAMAAARDDGRVAETVALILIALGEKSLTSLSPFVLCDAVRALAALNLPDDARRLAFEIAIAHGL